MDEVTFDVEMQAAPAIREATWETVELRRTIARAREEVDKLALSPPALETVNGSLDAAARGSSRDEAGSLRGRRAPRGSGASAQGGWSPRRRRRCSLPGASPRDRAARPCGARNGRRDHLVVDSRCGRGPHRWLPLWRRPLRADRATRLRKLLPLHALPEADGYRNVSAGAHRPRLDPRHRRGTRPRLRAARRVSEGVLLRVRLRPLEHQPEHWPDRIHPHEPLRRRPRRPALVSPVHRLRCRVGIDPGRRPPALPRTASAPARLTWTP